MRSFRYGLRPGVHLCSRCQSVTKAFLVPFQLNVFYNLDGGAFSEDPQHAAEKEAFSLDVAVTEEADHDHLLLTICTR